SPESSSCLQSSCAVQDLMIELSGQKIAFYRQLPDDAMQIIHSACFCLSSTLIFGKYFCCLFN
ncbi:hypothetical protein, partial [Nitrosomonas oligotropha]|uniref:hypothetical protein n=1 Tax=Nitrosomonas oligotropha TaxID=42354 RepID=UPI001961B85A